MGEGVRILSINFRGKSEVSNFASSDLLLVVNLDENVVGLNVSVANVVALQLLDGKKK